MRTLHYENQNLKLNLDAIQQYKFLSIVKAGNKVRFISKDAEEPYFAIAIKDR